MFEWFGIWAKIKDHAKAYLKGQASKVLSRLKDLKASTVQELGSLIATQFSQIGAAKDSTTDRITRVGHPDESIELRALPMSFFDNANALAALLVPTLSNNVELKALQTELSISNADWNIFLKEYCQAFVKYAAPLAVEQLMEAETDVYVDEVIIAIETEAYEIGGKAERRKMIKLYDAKRHGDRDGRIKNARRLWKKRKDAGYTYQLNI